MASAASDLTAQEPATVDIPLTQLTAAPGFGGKVSVKQVEGVTTTYLSLRNPVGERRLFALEGVLGRSIGDARALTFEYFLAGHTLEPTIVAVFFESDGGVWYRCVRNYSYVPGFRPVRLPLHGTLNRARFSTDEDEAIRWDQVHRVWLGVLVEGHEPGVFVVRRVKFTDAPFHPESPLEVSGSRFTWSVAQDPAVESSCEYPGFGAIDYRFKIPGARHMYAMVRPPVDVDELDAYSAVRFTYQADLPQGIDNLLVMLIERDGTQYQAIPAPAETNDWKTVTIPFKNFQRGSWSKDENDQLDLLQVNLLAIGMHGTTPKAATGTIRVRDIQIVP